MCIGGGMGAAGCSRFFFERGWQMRRAANLHPLICSSPTISGAMPGKPARHPFTHRVHAVAAAGFDGLAIHFRDHMRLVADGADPTAMHDCITSAGLTVPEVDFLADWQDDPALGSVQQAIKTWRTFGATRINVGADLTGHDVPLSDLVEPFRRLTGTIGDAGFSTALEVIAWSTINSIPQAIELTDVARGPAGLLLDNWHLACLKYTAADLPDPSLVAGL